MAVHSDALGAGDMFPVASIGNGEACEACAAAATNAYSGLQIAGCRGCEVRAVSNAPKPVRERFYQTIGDPEERKRFARAVSDEFERRRALIEGQK